MVPELNVAKLARDGGAWRGSVSVAAFERLGEVLFQDRLSAGAEVPSVSAEVPSVSAEVPSVSAALDFALDDQGRPRVTGTCKVAAVVCCPRCAETVDVEVESQLDFRVVATDAEAEGLMPALDVVVNNGPTLPLTALIEDDILLEIPEIGCVDPRACPHSVQDGEWESEGTPAKPFEALRALLPGRTPA